MKKKIKPHMDVYDTMYPLILVVANEAVSLKEINKYYMWSDGCDVTEKELDDGCCATTLRLVRRSDMSRVAFVKFNRHERNLKNKQEETNSFWRLAVHEAGHVVLMTYHVIQDDIAKDAQHQEPFCYYLDWVSTHIYETISKK